MKTDKLGKEVVKGKCTFNITCKKVMKFIAGYGGIPMLVFFYVLMAWQMWCAITIMVGPLKRRLGTPFFLVWMGVGFILYYNTLYNHFHATIVKPGSPKDIKKTETYRSEAKQGREGR
jgi:hypothetical protein